MLSSGPISFRPKRGKIERKKDWLPKALILLRKSNDLSNLSDLSAGEHDQFINNACWDASPWRGPWSAM
jgi:hypothetical protein